MRDLPDLEIVVTVTEVLVQSYLATTRACLEEAADRMTAELAQTYIYTCITKVTVGQINNDDLQFI